MDTWLKFINKSESKVVFKNNASELYFDEDNMNGFINRLSTYSDIAYVHPLEETTWGQRVVRLYDLDGHIIEVGENMQRVVERWLADGKTLSEIAKRMDISIEDVNSILN